jgi:hypothetical protein
MDQLIELLKQIQELAGVAIDALQGASEGAKEGGGGEGGPPEGAPHEGGGAPKGPPPEGPPPGR